MTQTLTTAHHGSFHDALREPRAAQREQLDRVVRSNERCAYGRQLDFPSIRSVHDFRTRVPLVSYEDLRPYVERMEHGEADVLVSERVRCFFTTSGSTAAPKSIPVTGAFIRDKWRAFSIFWHDLFARHPELRAGSIVTNFADSGEVTTTSSGIERTSESTFWASWIARLRPGTRPTIPTCIRHIADYESRYYTIARVLLEEGPSVLMTMNPSTLVLLFQQIAEHGDRLLRDVANGGLDQDVVVSDEARAYVSERYVGAPNRAAELRAALSDGTLSSAWPTLRAVICWRSPMLAPYVRRLDRYLDGVVASDYVTMASEGIIAIPLRDEEPGGALAIDTHFYEFIPEDEAHHAYPPTLLAHELEVGHRYVVVLTTSAGLYRYVIGDVVRVTGFIGRTPTVEFLYRYGATSSMTGEKLTEEQVSTAVVAAASALGLDPCSSTAFPSADPFPHYTLLAEFGTVPPRATLLDLARRFDEQLARRNPEYADKRKSLRLAAPTIWVARAGSYASWRQRRRAAGANDDQIKPVQLTRDPDFHREFDIVERVDAA